LSEYLLWGRRRNGLIDNFTLAVYMQFLVAADNKYLLLWKLRDIRRSVKHFLGWILLILLFISIAFWLLDNLGLLILATFGSAE
jgi:hypothetical protein